MLPRNLHDAPARLPRTNDDGRKNSLAHPGPKFSPGQVTAREPLCALLQLPEWRHVGLRSRAAPTGMR